jgi:hypothetical protein
MSSTMGSPARTTSLVRLCGSAESGPPQQMESLVVQPSSSSRLSTASTRSSPLSGRPWCQSRPSRISAAAMMSIARCSASMPAFSVAAIHSTSCSVLMRRSRR